MDVRIVCATNQDLKALIASQRFRQDLYYRISELSIECRRCASAARTFRPSPGFLPRMGAAEGRPKRGFTDDAMAVLLAYAWPGNVRELENKIKTAVIMSDAAMITAEDLGLATVVDQGLAFNLREVRARAEKETVRQAMMIADGNVSRAAELLGVTRPTLYDLMERYAIRPDSGDDKAAG